MVHPSRENSLFTLMQVILLSHSSSGVSLVKQPVKTQTQHGSLTPKVFKSLSISPNNSHAIQSSIELSLDALGVSSKKH